ncbi:hypothetical protein ABHF54_13385 [Nitrosomonas europaea]
MRGKWEEFSLDMLITLAIRADNVFNEQKITHAELMAHVEMHRVG